MLSKEDRQNIRKLHSYNCSIKEVRGKPVTEDNKPFVIPTYPELFATAINKIKSLGFESVERSSPSQANCIVRIFSTEHHKHDEELIYNIFGTVFYTKEKCVWTTEFEYELLSIKYDEFKTGRWLWQDEQVIFNHDFADFYVTIS